jgi:hypothetical protein
MWDSSGSVPFISLMHRYHQPKKWPVVNRPKGFCGVVQYFFRKSAHDDTGPSMNISAVVSAPEMAVSTHLMESNNLFSLERFSRL